MKMMKYEAMIRNDLLKLQEDKYRDFISQLIPQMPKDVILGIRIPILRKYAKKLYRENNYKDFLKNLPHKYFEENNLHSFLICEEKDFDTVIKETKKFLPYIDNWETCDLFIPKIFKDNKEKYLPYIEKWLKSDKPYVVRYGIRLLMYFDFNKDYLEKVSLIKSKHYYVNMMIAWFFAENLYKNYDETFLYIKERKFDKFIHNKIIAKACESLKISNDKKAELKKLKV